MSFISTIEPALAEGELKEIYENILESRGKIAEVHKLQSLNPPTIVHHMDLYMSIMYGKSPVKRVLREMIGVVVSMTNQCEYCIQHHAEAVKHYWKDDERMQKFLSNYHLADLNPRELAFCEYAAALTKTPEVTADGSWVQKLKDLGCSDREILDATLVCAYFNFVNRMVLSLGAQVSDEEVGGYKYEGQD